MKVYRLTSWDDPALARGKADRYRLPNSLPEATNLHLHGLHVPPEADDAFLELPSGVWATHAFDWPHGLAGIYGHHPHLHCRVVPQLLKSLARTLIVESPTYELLAAAKEHLLVLKDVALTGGRVAHARRLDER